VIERAQAVTAAQQWLDAWNAHDPERVVAHFADDVVISSPLAARLRPGSNGVLRGRDEVLSYYRDGLAAVPDLHFTLIEVCTGVDELTIVYRNHRDTVVTETLVAGADGRVREVRVGYGA
jgi:hypothetical protein